MILRLTILVSFSILSLCSFAQEFRLIDNKGSVQYVTRNSVDSSAIVPLNPVEGDVWFDTSNKITKVYDGTSWLEIQASSALSIWDKDEDTGIQVEKTADEDIIHFETGNATTKILRIENPGDFVGGGGNSAVIGLSSNTSNEFEGRLRLTAGQDDSFSDSQGASIDLHGNNATANTGRIDLVGGEAASGDNLALTVWGNNGASPTAISAPRIVMRGKGNVGIGNAAPNTEAILDLTNSQKFAFVLPSETDVTEIATPIEGMLIHSTNRNNTYLRADNAWKPIAHNSVTNELIFDGDDDADATNDNFYYVSFVVNGDWKVVRYDKTDVNVELQATLSNNSGQIAQPTDLLTCTALTYN